MKTARQYAIQSRKNSEALRLASMTANMRRNKAYRYAAERARGDPDGRVLAQFIERFQAYRSGWRQNPKTAIEEKLHHEAFRRRGFPPLCVDLELAAICDLACPFCFRQWIATPDKLMRKELALRILEQCAQLGVASIKLNWRGEPLMHPNLPEIIDRAKQLGILETIINTNAVTLTEDKSRALIDAGLDMIIYSFDGGTKQTYEQMRVGRFKENRFEPVYENIRRFATIRSEMGAVFPITKIQMILTQETFGEQESFFRLFSDCVDDVSVKAYTERGGSLPDLDESLRRQLQQVIQEKRLAEDAAYWRDMHGTLYLASGRLACEQPYQRMMVTYDGRVSMCCYDWGSEYPIGYVDEEAFRDGDAAYQAAMDKAQQQAKGFELLGNIRMPRRYLEPPKRVETLEQIWHGEIVNGVRQQHVEGRIDDVPICRRCPFKETYQWVAIDEPRTI